MLVLRRKPEQQIEFSGGIVVTVLSVERGVVRIGIEAPESVVISRPDARSQQQLDRPANSRGFSADELRQRCRALELEIERATTTLGMLQGWLRDKEYVE